MESELEGTHIIKILKKEWQDEQNEIDEANKKLGMYAANYNILRIMSGMGGLSYSSWYCKFKDGDINNNINNVPTNEPSKIECP